MSTSALVPAVTDLGDRLRVDTKLRSQLYSGTAATWPGSDVVDLRQGQLLLAMPSPTDHVQCVVGSRPEEQMRRVDARRVVAGMAHLQAVEYRPDPVDVRQPMCDEHRIVAAAGAQTPVAERVTGTYPLPAFIWPGDSDLRQEPRHDGRID